MHKWKNIAFIGLSGLVLGACGGDTDTDTTPNAEEQSSVIVTSESAEVVASSAVEESKEESSKETNDSGDFVKNASDAYFDGTILKGNTYSIKITDYKVIPVGETGNEYGENPVIAFWFDTLVAPDYDGDTAISPNIAWIMNFNAVQDNDPNMVNELNITSLPDENYLDNQSAEIKPGGTVSNAVAYELTDGETAVTLTAGSLNGDNFGSHDFEINK